MNGYIYSHAGNGWNYGVQVSKTTERARMFRYHTNGHVNSNYEYKNWMDKGKLIALLGVDLTESHYNQLHQNFEYVYHVELYKNIL